MENVENAPTNKQKLLETMKAHSNEDEEPVPAHYKAPAVLPADHPLLEKFQRALKEHLLKVNREMQEELDEMDANIEKMSKECNDLGAELYDQQESIDRQKDTLDDYNNQLKELSEKRMQHEENVAKLKKEFDAENNSYKELKRLHNENLMQQSHLQVLQCNMLKWTQEIEDEVLAAKRVVSKDAQQQRAISQQKKQMDLFLFNLNGEVRKLERLLENTNQSVEEQRALIDGLNRSISDANADVNALRNEHKRLIGAWNDVILSIKMRDKTLLKLRDELRDAKQTNKILDSSIDGTKKLCDKEMEQNETLEALRMRNVTDLEAMQKQVEKEQNEFDKLQNKNDRLTALIEQIEQDKHKADVEWHVNENQLKVLRRSLDKQMIAKVEIEDKMVVLLQDKITTDQANSIRSKVLRELQEKRRHMELAMFNTEQQLSQQMLDMEKCKALLAQNNDNLNKLNKIKQEVSKIANDKQAQINRITNSIGIKYKAFDEMNIQLTVLIDSAGGQEMDPIQMKLNALDKANNELEFEIRESQSFWLRLQGVVVSQSQKRADQVNAIRLAQKQCLVIAQKNLKVEADLEELKKQSVDTQRALKNLYTKIDQANAKLHEKKQFHQTEEVECLMSHQALIERLKAQELEVLQIEKELADRTNEIAETKELAEEKHREALSWETKWKMANETREYRNKETDAASEIGMMKAEIHRMQVRLLQLERAQERLVQDTEHCVMHRDHIFDGANVREKMPKLNVKTRFTVLHRLNDLKNKHKIANNELASATRAVENAFCRENAYHQEIRMLESVAEDEKNQNQLLCNEIALATLRKQENLERIVHIQTQTRQYRNLLSTTKPLPRVRSETKLQNDEARQTEINEHLLFVMETLLTEYSDQEMNIKRIIQTLKPTED